MESKLFTLGHRDYKLDEDGTLYVFTVSKWDWCVVSPKKIISKWNEYYRYALYDTQYDWDKDNEHNLKRYEVRLKEFNENNSHIDNFWPIGTILSRRLWDIIPPAPPKVWIGCTWKRFYISHGSLVLQYWYWIDVVWKAISYTENVVWNRFHVANWSAYVPATYKRSSWWRKPLAVWVINTILANAGSFSTDYIAEALWISAVVVTRVILWEWKYATLWDRFSYWLNIRASRWAFYWIVCYPWESVYDFINRILVLWSNDYRYQQYCSAPTRGIRKTKWRMWYGNWELKYGRDEGISKELIKRWVHLNHEFIWDEDSVEELCNYIDEWSIGGHRCWSIDKYEKYVHANRARMPAKVKIRKWYPCVLRHVGVASDKKTLFDLSDWQLINLYDYVMWDFESLPVPDMVNYVENMLEPEPDWNKYEAHGYNSIDDFRASYVSLLGGLSVRDFREAYNDMLHSIPYTNEVS